MWLPQKRTWKILFQNLLNGWTDFDKVFGKNGYLEIQIKAYKNINNVSISKFRLENQGVNENSQNYPVKV